MNTSNRLRRLAATRLRVLDRPDPEDLAVLGPVLNAMEREAANDDFVEFRRSGKTYIVDGVEFPATKGMGLLQKLFESPGSIGCKELDGEQLDLIQLDGTTLETLQLDERKQELMDHRAVREIVAEARRMREEIEEGVLSPDLKRHYEREIAEIERWLRQSTFGGRSCSFNSPFNRCRLRVKNAIDRAIIRLFTHPADLKLGVGPRRQHPQTSDIARHLKRFVRTGSDCAYVGNWCWKTR